MKRLLFVLTCLILQVSYAQIHILPKSKRYRRAPRPVPKESSLSRLSKQNDRIEQLLLKRKEKPNFHDNTLSYLPVGATLKARLLNSVISDNLGSPILVESLDDTVMPQGARISCLGERNQKRVYITCSLLILNNREYPIEAQMLNLDGSAGLKGEIYDGHEQDIAAKFSASILKGVAKVGKKHHLDIIPQGIADIIGEDSTAPKFVVGIQAGTNVLIYFKKGVKL